jgi:hypothetical protein
MDEEALFFMNGSLAVISSSSQEDMRGVEGDTDRGDGEWMDGF